MININELPQPAPCSSTRSPLTNLFKLNAAFKFMWSSLAIVCANKSPDPGVALNPPVPQPQLKY
jgi:hypothetical protein